MDPLENGQSNIVVKELIFLLGGFVVGYGMATSYFQYLAPKLEPVIVEKIVTKVVQATTTQEKPMAPARVYSFHVLRTLDNNGATTTLMGEDASTTEIVLGVLKKDKQFPVTQFSMDASLVNGAIVSGEYVLVSLQIPKGGESVVNYIIDIKNKKIVDTFGGAKNYYQDNGTIITGRDVSGLSYYMYGASTSVEIPNSVLNGNQSYTAHELTQEDGTISDFDVVATTTNSITLSIFDKKQEVNKAPDGTVYYKKVGERMFVIE